MHLEGFGGFFVGSSHPPPLNLQGVAVLWSLHITRKIHPVDISIHLTHGGEKKKTLSHPLPGIFAVIFVPVSNPWVSEQQLHFINF